MKRRMIVSVSSMHPIDSAAVVFHGVLGSARTIHVLINEDPHLSDNLLHAAFSPHHSVPLPLLIRHNDGTYRQLFMPMFEPHTNDPSCVRGAGSELARLAPFGRLDSIERRVERLLREALNSSGERGVSRAAAATSRMIRHIIGCTTNVRVSGGYLSAWSRTRFGQRAARSAIARIISRYPDLRLEFRDGGYISVGNDGSKLRHFNRQTLDDILGPEAEPIRFRGPLELAFQNELGILPHLPWYCREVNADSTGDVVVDEAISPITVATGKRTSRNAAGAGHRLTPSGYSLLDYEQVTIAEFRKQAARLDDLSMNALDDWRHLADNFTTTRQKGLKYQGGVGAYITPRVAIVKRDLRAGSLQPIDDVRARVTPISLLGQRMIAMVAVLKHLHDVEHTSGQLAPPHANALLPAGETLRPGVVPAVLQPSIGCLLSASAAWRRDLTLHALQRIEASPALQSLLPVASVANVPVVREATEVGGYYEAVRLLLMEVNEYYSCVLALLNGVLKANVWTMWLLLGSKGYAEAIRDVIAVRPAPVVRLSATLVDLRG